MLGGGRDVPIHWLRRPSLWRVAPEECLQAKHLLQVLPQELGAARMCVARAHPGQHQRVAVLDELGVRAVHGGQVELEILVLPRVWHNQCKSALCRLA